MPVSDEQQTRGVNTADTDEKIYSGAADSGSPTEREQLSRAALDDARQMLDSIAGISPPTQPDKPREALNLIRAILFFPVTLLKLAIGLLVRPFEAGNNNGFRQLYNFLRHPGHFFWFSRVNPDAATSYFNTTSTDVMTNHARRYGAHAAILLLAVVVVVFGGFSGLATQVKSVYASVVNPPMVDGSLLFTGDGRDIYISAVVANTNAFPRRMEVYSVKQNDSLREIARTRNVSLETILYANNLIDPDTDLSLGQRLVLPETTGMLHIANPGDTVSKIAEIYGVDPKTILSYKFNNLEGAEATETLKPLREIFVPGGAFPQRNRLYMYNVRRGDNLKSVSEKFGLSVDTLLDNNDIDNGLIAGQQIRILPTDGVIYTVKAGDTLDSVARYLSTSVENLLNFRPNNLARSQPLLVGSSLIVPGGKWPPPPPPEPQETPAAVRPRPATNQAASTNSNAPAVAAARTQPPVVVRTPAPTARPAGNNNAPVRTQAPAPVIDRPTPKPAPAAPPANPSSGLATGRLVWPERGVITAYFGDLLWYGWHRGIDISAGCGNRIVAADGGTVVEAGWNAYGYGISVVIDHGNGLATRYAHFSSMAVGWGQRVFKGQTVGYEGTTGNSTGCHLHFEVIRGGVQVNPYGYLS